MPSAPPLPDFVVIGAQRSGTRWLRSNLDMHPEIFMPSFDLSYFDTPSAGRRTTKWYRTQFEAWDGEAHLGESSPGYMLPSSHPADVAKRIDTELPGAKVVAVLRDPVDRMFSSMANHIKRGRLPGDTELFDLIARHDPAVDDLDLVGAGRYAEILHSYASRFGDRLHVVLTDDVRDRPDELYASVCAHLGASTDFRPRHLERVLHSNRASVRVTPLQEEHRRILYNDLFRDDVEELQELIDRDLSAWDPGSRPLQPPWGDAPSIRHDIAADEDDEDEADDVAVRVDDEADEVDAG
jgi:hypothetical protein